MLKINKQQIKKMCAIITATCFSITIVSNNILGSTQIDTQNVKDNYFLSQNSINTKSIVSEKYGKVTSFNDANSDTVVINIQDLHCDYGVQKNISALIKELNKQNFVQNVYVEGGVGNIDTGFLSNLNVDYKERILENLLKMGSLTGAEYYSIINNKEGFLKGVENKDLHRENIARLVNVLNNKSKNLKYLSKINSEIDFLKAKNLSSNNKKFNKLISKYEQGKITQDQYFRYLISYLKESKISINKYPNLSIYLGLSQDSKGLDFNKVTNQLEKIVQTIKSTVSYEEYTRFLKMTDNMSNVQTLKGSIEAFCNVENIVLKNKYPDLYSFLSLRNKVVNFNPIELVKEERELVDVVRTYLSEDKVDLEVAYLSDFQKYFSGYLTTNLTAAQWRYFQIGINKFKELYAKYSISNDVAKLNKEFEQLNKFYEINTYRNEIFVENMHLGSKNQIQNEQEKRSPFEILQNAKNIVILVAGGYHTVGVNKILNEKNISNITITPSVLNSTEQSKQNYEFIAKQQSIQGQTIALGLLANATQKEQIQQIVQSLFLGQKLDGINISILVEQLNQVFDQKIKIKNLIEENKLEFTLEDGNVYKIDINQDISRLVNEQEVKEMPSSVLTQVTDEKLKDITNLVLRTTFNMGQEIFAPQIYQISKEVCVFMVENKWYLGNGAIWNIANSQYNGQNLDGVEPVIYEYMPETMQSALLEKEQNNNLNTSAKKDKQSFGQIVQKTMRTIVLPLLLIFIMLSSTACSIFTDQNDPTSQVQIGQTITLTDSEKQFQENIEEQLEDYYAGNGGYKSFIYEDMSSENQSVLSFDQRLALQKLQNLYDQSLVALSYMQMGEIDEAEKVLTAINGNKVLYKSNLEDIQSTGEVIWVGIAAEQYKILTGSDKFDDLIARVDKFLYSVSVQGGGYVGQKGNALWVSTEHILDVIAYYNLKTVYDSSDETKQKLTESSQYLYNNLYIESEGRFRRGFEDNNSVLDTCAWGIQVLTSIKEMNPDIYKSSGLNNIDLDKLVEYVENNFSVKVTHNGVVYNNLYRWSNESSSPVSFEWTMQMAVSYNLLGNSEKANAILSDVKAYSKALGFEDDIPYTDVNNTTNYKNYGWDVFVVPSLCTTVGQAMQIEFGSFFFPITKIENVDYTASEYDGNNIFIKNEGINWRTYSSAQMVNMENFKEITFKIKLLNNENIKEIIQFQFLPGNKGDGSDYGVQQKDYYFDSDGNLTVTITKEDFLENSIYDIDFKSIKLIVIAGKASFGREINSKSLNLDIMEVNIVYNDGTTKEVLQVPDNKTDTSGSTEQQSSSPSSILPSTLGAINKLIEQGKVSTKSILREILNKETKFSILHPIKFVFEHKTQSGKKGAAAVIYSAAIAIFVMFNVLLLTTLPLIVITVISLIVGLLANITTHTIIDYFYLKSTGLQESIRLYGSNVSLLENGQVNVADFEKSVPMYVINDKPSNYKEFDFKPISVKFKSKDGNNVKGWLGRYQGASVLFVDGANYEDIVNNFRQTRQFNISNNRISSNIDIIEVDLNNPNAEMTYSKSGNPLIGINTVKTNNIIDIQKEMALLSNKKVEAITINQNIAVFIDDDINNITSYNDLLSSIDLYIKNDNLGVDSKILFTDKYIDKILQLIREEVSKEITSEQEIDNLVTDKFIEIIQASKNKNKNISVVFEQADTNTDLKKYFKYGIFSYVVNGKYIDTVAGTDVNTKIITNLDQVQGFDGSISIIKVSSFKDEIASSSGIFTFLNSAMNIKEMLEKRNIDFIIQVAKNFDFNQMPEISNDIIIGIIKSEDINKYSVLSKYINDTSSISMYYNGLKNDKEKEIFVKTILERMLAVNLLRANEAYNGLKDHRLEEILAKALLIKYQNNIDPNIRYTDGFSIDDTIMASEVEQKLLERILVLTDEAFNKNTPQAINEIIEILPLYADRNTELRTSKVEVMNVQNIRGILSAA
ncbi:MAG: hypothetical protein PHG84_01775 [Endomicrobiaceae bacterium]|nr:hypothetical protein [Endomicrobiaceae bacterium]